MYVSSNWLSMSIASHCSLDDSSCVTNKKGDQTGFKGRQKGDKADTMTNKKRDKKKNKRKQKGYKSDTVTNKKGDKTGDRRETRLTND